MFDFIRNHQKFLQFVLLLLILPAFVFFGVSGYQKGDKEQTVATVGDTSVTKREFDQALQNRLGQMRQMVGDQVDIAAFDTPEMRKGLLDALIAKKAIAIHARDSHLVVTDDMIRESLAQVPNLRKPDGTLDGDRFKQVLASQGQTEQSFLAQYRRDIAGNTFAEAISYSVIAPRQVKEQSAIMFEQIRNVKPLAFKTADFVAKVTPTDEQIKAYYEKNADSFKTIESATVEYLVLSPEVIAAKLSVNPDELKSYYESNKANYSTKEERRISHILFNANPESSASDKQAAKTKAEAALAEVKKDPSKFETIARAQSQDDGSKEKGGDLGFVKRADFDKALTDAAWALKDNEISSVVESSAGFHIVKLNGVKPSVAQAFETVKSDIEAQYRKQTAAKQFAEAADGFTNSVYEAGDSFKAVAEKYKLTVQTAQGLSRVAGAPQPGAGAILTNPKFLKAVFSDASIKGKKNTEAIEVSPGTLVSSRITEYTAAALKPLDVVKADVVKRVQQDEAKKLAVAAGQAKLKELQAGAAASGFVGGDLPVSRLTPGGLSRPSVDAIFRAQTTPLPAYSGLDDEIGFTVYQIVSVKPGEGPEVIQRRAQLIQRTEQTLSQQEFTTYTDSLKSRAKVTRNDALTLKADAK